MRYKMNKEDIILIIIPPTLRYIHDYAFSGTGIKNMTIPDTVIYIGHSVFENCT